MQKHKNFHGNENALFGKLIIHLIKDAQHIQQMRNQAESPVGVPNCDKILFQPSVLVMRFNC